MAKHCKSSIFWQKNRQTCAPASVPSNILILPICRVSSTAKYKASAYQIQMPLLQNTAEGYSVLFSLRGYASLDSQLCVPNPLPSSMIEWPDCVQLMQSPKYGTCHGTSVWRWITCRWGSRCASGLQPKAFSGENLPELSLDEYQPLSKEGLYSAFQRGGKT